jgi:hypothetical protein
MLITKGAKYCHLINKKLYGYSSAVIREVLFNLRCKRELRSKRNWPDLSEVMRYQSLIQQQVATQPRNILQANFKEMIAQVFRVIVTTPKPRLK